jgi:outer membrane receptor protein involved in Fe transport
MPTLRLLGLSVFATLAVSAQTVVLEPLVATASRAAGAPMQQAFSLKTFSGDALRLTPGTALDSVLRSSPAFSLFRRADSLTANPTAQGVSLRGLGPSGASRSLVLLDGVPLNDPFGGWVAWSKVPRESLTRVEIAPGAGATTWGNAALGGVVQLTTAAPSTARSGRVSALGGDFETRSGEAEVNTPTGAGALQLSGRIFSTEGFRTVASERRGMIDTPAGGRHRWLAGRWRQALSDRLELTLTARTYEEKRANGTPYQRNASRENFGSVALAAQPGATFNWTAVAYGQDQSFSSTFSGVNATRTAETPASDQYAVPANAAGIAWTGGWAHGENATTSAGFDARSVRGETRELFTFANGAYTRRRLAGGKQALAGAFVQHQRPLTTRFTASAGARLDYWRESAGHRNETEIATGAVLREDVFAVRDGVEFSPSTGLVWRANNALRLRAAAQHAFRRPTLNELYRPFRVGNVITEANADLRTETVTSGELGADLTHGALHLSAVGFWNELRDAVGNVTVARGPGTVPGFGFIPTGGAGRRRLNLEEARVRGLEISAEWRASDSVAIQADYLLNDARVRRASAAPGLAGLRLAQVPRHSASAGARWTVVENWILQPRVRWIGGQFEDDENQLPLAKAVVVDFTLSRRFSNGLEIFASVENVTDERLETGRSADGLVNVGQPRFATGGVRFVW